MKKYLYGIGTVTLALAMSGLPALALAESNGDGEGVSVQMRVTAQGVEASTSENVRESVKQKLEVTNEQMKQTQEAAREQQKQSFEASSTNRIGGEGINLELESDSEQATSFEDLNQKIEVRKHELAQEVASSSPDQKNIIENANEVRLAVHALLSSRDIVGSGNSGIGQQVSEIAKSLNDSVATTTNAEAKIQARGFFTRLFFGGDSASATAIQNAVAQNQDRIDALTGILAQANISADVKATLTTQMTALKDAQVRLQALADSEQKTWGLFSWRF